MTFDYLSGTGGYIFIAGKDGKQGYLKNTLEPLVPFIYDKVLPINTPPSSMFFSSAVAWQNHGIVIKNNKYGVVSTKTGLEVLPCDFDTIHHPYYCNYGLGQEFWNRPEVSISNPPHWVFASKDSKWGCYIITKNDPYIEIFPPKYKYIWGPFKNNNYVYAKTLNDKYVLLDLEEGKEVEELGEVDAINLGSENYGFCTVFKDNKWGVFSFTSKELTHDFVYHRINPYPTPSNKEVILVYTKDKQVGVINPLVTNKVVVPPLYNNVVYEKGSFIVFQFGKKGIVNKGKEIIPCEYSYIENVINTEYNRFFIVQKFKKGKYGILDLEHKYTTSLCYEDIKVINRQVEPPWEYNGGYINMSDLKVPTVYGLKDKKWDLIKLQ